MEVLPELNIKDIPIAHLQMWHTEDTEGRDDGFEVCDEHAEGAFPVFVESDALYRMKMRANIYEGSCYAYKERIAELEDSCFVNKVNATEQQQLIDSLFADVERWCLKCCDLEAQIAKPLPTALHIKTGNIYNVVGEAINATNDQSGQVMIIYERDGQMYVREAQEFRAKFSYGEQPDEKFVQQPQ